MGWCRRWQGLGLGVCRAMRSKLSVFAVLGDKGFEIEVVADS